MYTLNNEHFGTGYFTVTYKEVSLRGKLYCHGLCPSIIQGLNVLSPVLGVSFKGVTTVFV